VANRRKSIWVDTLHSQDTSNSGFSLVSLMASLDLDEIRTGGLTLVRTIICHEYAYSVHDAGEGSQNLDVGVAVTNQESFLDGSVPDPDVQTDMPSRGWVYRCRHRLHGFAADQPAVDVRAVYRDIRASRKIENGVVYLHLRNNAADGVAATVRTTGITRCLFLLG